LHPGESMSVISPRWSFRVLALGCILLQSILPAWQPLRQSKTPSRAVLRPGRHVDVWCAELLQTDSFVFEEFPPPGILGLEEGGKFFRRVRLS